MVPKKFSSSKNKCQPKIGRSQRLRVLIVEDSEDDALLVIRHLKKGGYEPVYERVQTAAAMKKALKEKQWDIILCDYKMPNFSAPKAISLLRKMQVETPVIIVSGTIGEETAIECMRIGACDYIMKSNLSRLCPAIMRELKEAKVRQKQKKTKEKLHKEEQLFRTLAEQSSDIIVLVNSEGNVVYENPAVEALLGLTPKERIGKKVFERIHPDDLKEIKDSFIALLTDKNLTLNRRKEVRLRHKDGSWRTFEIAASNLVNHGVIEAVIVNLHDITERKQVEDLLKQSEERYCTILDEMDEGYEEVDLNGNYTFVNDAFLRIFGYSREDMIGSNFRKYTADEESVQKLVHAYTEIYKTGVPIKRNLEWKVIRKDGSLRTTEFYASLLRNEKGRPVGFRGIGRDITERKRVEEELRFRDVLLATQQEVSIDGILVVDENARILLFNRRFIEMWGLPAKLVEDRVDEPVLQFVTDQMSDPRSFLQRVQYLYEHRQESSRDELMLADGRFFDRYSAPMIGSDKRYFGRIWYFRDITERKRAEEEHQESERKYKLISEKMTDVVWISDMDLKITYVTPSIYNVLGFTPEEAKNQTTEEILTPDSLAYGMEILAKELAIEEKGDGAPNRTVSIMLEYYHKDGSTRWMDTIISGLRNNQGVLTGMHGVARDITLRKRVEDQFRASEEKFLKAFRYNPSAMSISTLREGRYIDVNNAYLNTFGYQREELIGRTSSEINLWVDTAERDVMIQGLTEAGKVNNLELRTCDKYGNIHWLLTSASLIKTGGETYLLTQSLDFTDRKRAEEALKAANKQLQDIIEFLPDATLIVDKDDKLIAWNRAMEEMTGIPKAAMLGQEHHQASMPFYGEVRPFLMDLVGMDDQELAARYSNVRRIGSAVHAEVFTPALYHNRGAYVFAVASPLLDDTGNIVGLIESIRDITESKQAEIQREAALESLRKSEELYTRLVNSIPDIIVRTDLEGNILFVNDKALEIGGYSREEMIGHQLHSFVAPEDREAAQKNKQLMLENEAGQREYNLLTKDGRKIPFDINGDVLRDEKGIPFGFVNVGRDISERRRTKKIMREQDELLRDINRNLPGVIYQFYAKDSGEYGMTYISEQVDEFSKMIVGDETPNLDTFFPSFVSRVFEEDRDKLMTSIKEAVDTVSPWNFEGRVSTSSGDLIWFHGLSVPKRLDDRIIFNGILLNISERKLAEEKSRQSEEKFRNIFMTSPECIAITRFSDGTLIDVNTAFEDMIGSKRKEVIGKKVTEPPLNFWVNLSEREFMLAELKSEKDIVQGELKFRRHDGSERFGVYVARTINIDDEECIIFILQDITERRQLEEKFHKVFITTPSGISLTRLNDGLVIDINKGYEDIIGWKREEIIGTKSTAPPLNFWIDMSVRDALVAEIKSGSDVLNREITFRRKDGSIRDGIYSARTINIGNDECIIFILQDITERKKAEEELKRVQLFNEAILESIPGILYLYDDTGHLMYWNKQHETLTGYSGDEIKGRFILDWFGGVEPDTSDIRKCISEAMTKGHASAEGHLLTKNGNPIFMFFTGVKLNIAGKDHLLGIGVDITERKMAEEKFRKIFVTTPDCITISKLTDGILKDVNRGFEDMVGWKKEEVVGLKATEPRLNLWVDPAERKFMVVELQAGRDVLHREFEFRRKDGVVRTGIYSARHINIDGEETLIFVMQDVTEKKRMEKELVESHKMNVISQIASGVAHEVRNPLHAIQAISEAMAVDVDEKSDYKEYLTHIKAQVMRLSHLMNDLLELSKPMQPSQFRKVLLTEIVAVALRDWLEAHPQLSQQVKVVNKLQSDDFVLVDTNKIQQVIINIMENAVQHSPKDEGIFLELGKTSEDCIIMKAIDRGTGIKPEDQIRIFEPFYTTRKSGTGLGLSICKHIIESHGGTIDLVNNKNAPGCTVSFTLPVYSNKERK